MSTSGFDPMPKDDAVAYFGCCSDHFGELAALFDVIVRRTHEDEEIHKLARLGKNAASDSENTADAWREQLDKGGFRQ